MLLWLLQGVRGIKGPKGHPGDEGLKVAIFQGCVILVIIHLILESKVCFSVLFYALKCCFDICDVKGERGEEGAGGRSGGPVSVSLSFLLLQ